MWFGFLDRIDVIHLATERVRRCADAAVWEKDLAVLLADQYEQVDAILQLHAPVDPALGRVWVYLALAHLYEHRADVPNVFETIDLLYDDLGFPEEMSHLVRWYPLGTGQVQVTSYPPRR